ncbi:MAG TPA: hypothetical protein VIJ70_01540 [Gaiellaceae bacterium]
MADELDAEALAAQLAAFDVDEFLVATASSLASLAFAKLEQGNLGQAKRAIDALGALIPQVGGELKSDLERALTSLQVAYATAATA